MDFDTSPSFDTRGSVARLIRDFDRGYRHFCEKRGIDPHEMSVRETNSRFFSNARAWKRKKAMEKAQNEQSLT